MAKAERLVLPAAGPCNETPTERLTAAKAAIQIVGLINSRPVSPWPHEIEAIIARVGSTAPHIVPVDFDLVRLISAWRQQRDIIDGTCVAGEGCARSYEESKQAQAIVSKAMDAACDLAKQIWERAKAETWRGGSVNPLTLAVLAEIVLHHENGASNTLIDDAEYYMDQRATAELMVAVLSHVRNAGAGSDLLPMEGRFLPPALLKGGRAHE
jgi:hypothetical protein